jgi:hypothetical protein
MTRFPTYPRDILDRADALLSSKYPDGIVDPRFVEVACEAMMAQREFDATFADGVRQRLEAGRKRALSQIDEHVAGIADNIAKAIRGASPVPETAE